MERLYVNKYDTTESKRNHIYKIGKEYDVELSVTINGSNGIINKPNDKMTPAIIQ
ncbi:MAG: hypothetical protein ACLSDN_08260 [Anaerococcus vaginalis]